MEEKIKITISKNVLTKLENDCAKFIFHKGTGEINRNLFFNTLILNYYKRFSSIEETTKKDIKKIISSYNTSNEQELTNEIVKYLASKELDTMSTSTTIINIKPTKVTADAIQYINNYLLSASTISSYYRRLFESYAKFPQSQREQIICKPVYTKIQTAIKEKRKVYIILKNGNEIKEASIYTIKASSDELYNYLLFESKNGFSCTLRLSKIKSIEILNATSTISKETKALFDKQIQCGIQYPIYSPNEEPVKVKFTEKGLRMFKKIYLYRPIPDSIQDNIYTFTCSHYQIEYYFKRFGGEAIIVSPEKLTKHLQYFYSDSYQDYTEALDDDILDVEMAIAR
ncbi:MAG: WYL domain-containing protein [Anaeroplasmataceae bacterium]|nr:WYL domain-containing protein [Anaeroplasmataceae bacterium]MDE6413985.1 WYL domain-containing protein [Anaeroplasmataceae bacterium]